MGMIITRQAGEGIRIGETLVTVVRMRNGRVKIDVTAPAEIAIQPVERELPKTSDRQHRKSGDRP